MALVGVAVAGEWRAAEGRERAAVGTALAEGVKDVVVVVTDGVVVAVASHSTWSRTLSRLSMVHSTTQTASG